MHAAHSLSKRVFPEPEEGPINRFAAVLLSIAFIAGCGGSEEASPTARPAESSPAPAPAPKPVPEPEPEPRVECLEVGQDLAEAIMLGATATGMSAIRGSAVKSPDFEKVYFIAVEFTLAGADNVVGVWASNSLERGGGIIMAADAFVKEFTDCGDAASTAAAISGADPSIRDAWTRVDASSPY